MFQRSHQSKPEFRIFGKNLPNLLTERLRISTWFSNICMEIIGPRVTLDHVSNNGFIAPDEPNDLIIPHALKCIMIAKTHVLHPGEHLFIWPIGQLRSPLAPDARAKLCTRKILETISSPEQCFIKIMSGLRRPFGANGMGQFRCLQVRRERRPRWFSFRRHTLKLSPPTRQSKGNPHENLSKSPIPNPSPGGGRAYFTCFPSPTGGGAGGGGEKEKKPNNATILVV